VIIGAVSANREAVVPLEVRGPQDPGREIETIVDTGFNGFLTLPHAVILALGLPHLGRGRATLANGIEALFDIYESTVMWEGEPRTVEVDATAGMALLGMAMLEGHDLWIHAAEGGGVTIHAAG
jgi:clan AA aspartic protease